MPTLNSLEQDVYRRFGFNTSSVDSATQTRIRAFINETQNEILSEPGLDALRNGTLTFASVASTAQYSLPQAAATVKAIYETTNDRRLEPRSFDWYRSVYPDVSAVTGTPAYYVDLGLIGLSSQPADASEIFIKSTAAGDTGTAYLEGYRTGGYFASLSKAMTGVTAVSFSATLTDFVWLTKVYLSAAAVGTVTLHEDSGAGTELARIPLGQTLARYRRIALVPTPASAVTYTVDFDYDVPDMSIANDEPILPPRFHRMLATGARMKEYEKQDDTVRYRIAEKAFQADLTQLRFYIAQSAVGKANLQGTRRVRTSRLGPWFEGGS